MLHVLASSPFYGVNNNSTIFHWSPLIILHCFSLRTDTKAFKPFPILPFLINCRFFLDCISIGRSKKCTSNIFNVWNKQKNKIHFNVVVGCFFVLLCFVFKRFYTSKSNGKNLFHWENKTKLFFFFSLIKWLLITSLWRGSIYINFQLSKWLGVI